MTCGACNTLILIKDNGIYKNISEECTTFEVNTLNIYAIKNIKRG